MAHPLADDLDGTTVSASPPPAIRTERLAPLGTCTRPVELTGGMSDIPCGGPIKSGCPFVRQYPECEYEPKEKQ